LSSSRAPPPKFVDTIGAISENKKSRIILALDLPFREQTSSIPSSARGILSQTRDYICAVKINFHLLLPLSLSEIRSLNEYIGELGLISIADIKLNDIDNTNKITTDYLWSSGFSAVIVNPFAGYEGALDTVFESAKSRGKGVITLAFMSHRGADEGYGLKLEDGSTMFELLLEKARLWSADGVVVGSTRPDSIGFARARLGRECKIFSPGSGAQGGDPVDSLKAGSDYVIFGRTIVESQDPCSTARELHRRLLPWSEIH
jgi:orotidine-5'-phosphate decarboxylase